jgi:hypothetical protein
MGAEKKKCKKNAFFAKNGHKNVTEMQNRRDTIPNQRTKPASNAGLMDGGRPDDIRDNGRKENGIPESRYRGIPKGEV